MSEIKHYYDSQMKLLALFIPSDYSNSGIEFLTKDEDYQQVACMSHLAGHVIAPHYHNQISRIVDYTCETLILRKGILAVDLYEDKVPIHSFEMKAGDMITLFSGGHGFKVIEDIQMFEIKQGPFMGENDKTRF
ncbi:MAG: hypothetical protein HFG51_11600 [Lachnospiraceae bacterium]|nr:hypothetical protein [Lachnospiraceae bacterium]